MKDFDIVKYLKEHQLGSYGILNHYVDLEPIAKVVNESLPGDHRKIRSYHDERNVTAMSANSNYQDCMRKAKTDDERSNCDQALDNATGYSSTMMDYPARFLKTNEGEIEEAIDLEKVSQAISLLKPLGLSKEEIAQIPTQMNLYYDDPTYYGEGEVEEGFGDEWDPSKPSMKSQKALQQLQNTDSEDIEQDTEMGVVAPNIGRDRISAAIEALSNAGFSAKEIQSMLNKELAFE